MDKVYDFQHMKRETENVLVTKLANMFSRQMSSSAKKEYSLMKVC